MTSKIMQDYPLTARSATTKPLSSAKSSTKDKKTNKSTLQEETTFIAEKSSPRIKQGAKQSAQTSNKKIINTTPRTVKKKPTKESNDPEPVQQMANESFGKENPVELR